MSISYETVAALITTYLVWGLLLSAAVSFVMEFIIKVVFPKISSHVLIMNWIIGLLSVISSVAYMYFTSATWYVAVCMWVLIWAISMNGYDKIYSYVWSTIKKAFGKESN